MFSERLKFHFSGQQESVEKKAEINNSMCVRQMSRHLEFAIIFLLCLYGNFSRSFTPRKLLRKYRRQPNTNKSYYVIQMTTIIIHANNKPTFIIWQTFSAKFPGYSPNSVIQAQELEQKIIHEIREIT